MSQLLKAPTNLTPMFVIRYASEQVLHKLCQPSIVYNNICLTNPVRDNKCLSISTPLLSRPYKSVCVCMFVCKHLNVYFCLPAPRGR